MPPTSSLPNARALLRTYLLPRKFRASVLVCLVLAAIGLDLANPQVLRLFIDSASQGSPLQTLVLIALAFRVIAVAAQVVGVAETYFAENVGLTATFLYGRDPVWVAST